MKIVIRAGGIGTRLWPVSRIKKPKQFQKIISDRSMIRTTYERSKKIVKKNNDIFISVNYKLEKLLKKEIPEIKKSNIILEADARNTGPAICLESCYLEKFFSPKEVIASLPSDDYISNEEAFKDLLLKSEEFINENPDYILTPAVKSDYPDTGYSYLKAGKNLMKGGQEGIYKVDKIIEKPNIDFLDDILKTGIYYSHTGIYLWKLENILELFKKFQQGMYEVCYKVANLLIKNKKSKKLIELYTELEKISIETAITSKTNKIAMSVSNRVGWSDLGKWHIIKKIFKNKNSNFIKGQVVVNFSENNLIYSNIKNKLLVVNDIKDLAVVDTDDALYITSLKNSAEIKNILDKIKKEYGEKYL